MRHRLGLADLATACALIVGTAVLYAPVAGFEFVRYDDPAYVSLDPRMTQGLTAANALWALRAYHVGNWHPLTLLSHMADVSLFGLNAGAQHAVNVLIHGINAALVLALFVVATGRRAMSAVGAAVFAAHPLNVEAVAWVSQRKSVLGLFFLLLAMIAHVSWARRGGAVRYAAVLIALAASLASKPMAVAAPVLLLALDGWPLGRFQAAPGGWGRVVLRRVAEKVPHAVLVAAAAIVTMAAQGEGGALASWEALALGPRVARFVFALGWYPLRLVVPSDLALFYPMDLGPGAAAKVAAAAVFVAAVTVLAFAARRRFPEVPFAAVWYLAGILPVGGLVAYGTQIVADRYAYLALLGPIVAIASIVERGIVGRGRRLAIATLVGAIVVVASFALVTRGALAPWRTSLLLHERGVERAPANPHALANCGLDLVEAGRFDEGIAMLKRAEAIVPLYRPIHVNLGYALAKMGREDEARAHYEEALRLRGGDAKIATELGRVLARLGRTGEAEARFREAIDLDPGFALPHLLLGTALHVAGRDAEAAVLLERAVALEPENPRARTVLALALERLGRRGDAIAALEAAVRLDPSFERARDELARMREEASGASR